MAPSRECGSVGTAPRTEAELSDRDGPCEHATKTGVLFPTFRGLPCVGWLSTCCCVTLGTVLHSGLKHQVLRLPMSTSNGLVMLSVFEQSPLDPTDVTLTANSAKRSHVGCRDQQPAPGAGP